MKPVSRVGRAFFFLMALVLAPAWSQSAAAYNWYLETGRAAEARGDLSEAEASFVAANDEAEGLDEHSALDAFYTLEFFYEKHGQYEKAESHCEAAIARWRKNQNAELTVAALEAYSSLLQRVGRYDEASLAAQQADLIRGYR